MVSTIQPMKRLKTLVFMSLLLILTSGYTENKEGNNNTTESNKEKVSATFLVKSFKVSKEGFVSWTTTNEQGSLPFIVEQFIFDKWVKVAEVPGIGTPTPNSYSVPIILHSGENKFRVRQKGYDKMSRFSDIITYYSKKEPVTYSIINKNQTISFSADTYFIIYDPYGRVVKQGYGNSIDISNYAKGYYCLIYDNKLGGFTKKKVLFKNTSFPIVVSKPKWLGK